MDSTSELDMFFKVSMKMLLQESKSFVPSAIYNIKEIDLSKSS